MSERAIRTTSLRVAFVINANVDDPQQVSGMPYRIAATMRARVPNLMMVTPEYAAGAGEADAPRRMSRWIPRVVRRVGRRVVNRAREMIDRTRPDSISDRTLAAASATSRALSARAAGLEYDVIFAPLGSDALWEFETDRPIVYFSDATAAMVGRTYERVRSRGDGYIEAVHAAEQRAISRSSQVAFASAAMRQSAIDEYGADPARTHVIPMGSSVAPTPEEASVFNPEPPTRECLRIIIIASDPVRKRLGLAIEVVERLNRSGYRSHLEVVGPVTGDAERSRVVTCHGRLLHAVPEQLQRLRSLLASSHLMILPSIAEMFGIAPCESAQFGRPSIVSDAGGLPTAVLDGETGIVVPVKEGAEVYADHIMRLVDDPARYRAMSRAALLRARTVLNWDAFGDRIVELLESAAGDGAGRGHSRLSAKMRGGQPGSMAVPSRP